MFFVEWVRFVLLRIATPLVGGLAFAFSHAGASAASDEPPHGVYVISDQDGYGILECLTQKRGCGKAVANSWCEGHGHGPALAFGRADDMTASIGAASRLRVEPSAAIVACAD
jgi:hypothetical protein